MTVWMFVRVEFCMYKVIFVLYFIKTFRFVYKQLRLNYAIFYFLFLFYNILKIIYDIMCARFKRMNVIIIIEIKIYQLSMRL